MGIVLHFFCQGFAKFVLQSKDYLAFILAAKYKKFFFGLVIVFHIFVMIKMILAKTCKNSCVQF